MQFTACAHRCYSPRLARLPSLRAMFGFDSPLPLVTICFAALLHGISGLGFPLLVTAILATFMPMKLAVAISLWPTLLLNLLSITSVGWRHTAAILRRYARLAASSVLGSFVGMTLLVHLPQAWFQVLLAAMMLILVAQQAQRGQSAPALITASARAEIGFGLLAGLIGGATNAMSPVILLYLLARKTPVEDIVPAANLCYATGKLCQLITLYAVAPELLPAAMLPDIALATALAAAFLLIGLRIRRFLPARRFRVLLLGLVFALALFTGISGLRALLA